MCSFNKKFDMMGSTVLQGKNFPIQFQWTYRASPCPPKKSLQFVFHSNLRVLYIFPWYGCLESHRCTTMFFPHIPLSISSCHLLLTEALFRVFCLKTQFFPTDGSVFILIISSTKFIISSSHHKSKKPHSNPQTIQQAFFPHL